MTAGCPMLSPLEELSRHLRQLEAALVDLCGVADRCHEAASALTILKMVKKARAATDQVREEAGSAAHPSSRETVVLKLLCN